MAANGNSVSPLERRIKALSDIKANIDSVVKTATAFPEDDREMIVATLRSAIKELAKAGQHIASVAKQANELQAKPPVVLEYSTGVQVDGELEMGVGLTIRDRMLQHFCDNNNEPITVKRLAEVLNEPTMNIMTVFAKRNYGQFQRTGKREKTSRVPAMLWIATPMGLAGKMDKRIMKPVDLFSDDPGEEPQE